MSNEKPAEDAVRNPLTPEQQALLEEVQRLFAAGHEEVSDELLARLDRAFPWSDDDEASVERSLYFTAYNPFFRREMALISGEVAAAELADARRKLDDLQTR